MMKKFLVLVVVVIGVVATIPLWGSCDLKARYCSISCDIKHFNNDMKASGCRASCSLANARCHGNEAAKGFDDFMSGLKGR